MPEEETYGRKIARLRGERGLTQDDVAEQSGVPKRTLQDVEGDKREGQQRKTRLKLNAFFGIEGTAEEDARSRSEDVQAYSDLMGAALEALPENERMGVMTALWKELIRLTREE